VLVTGRARCVWLLAVVLVMLRDCHRVRVPTAPALDGRAGQELACNDDHVFAYFVFLR